MYQHYKPLRNKLREHRLFDILITAHALLQWAQFGRTLPRHLQNIRMNRDLPGRGVGLMEWEVDVLIREALLHAEANGRRSAAAWSEFAELGNRIKNIENAAWAERSDPQDDDIWWELYRISHRQFPWQTGVSHATILRHFKIFDHQSMRPLFEAVHGMTPAEHFQLGLSLAGHFMGNVRINLPIDNQINAVPAETIDRFLDRAAASLTDIRDRISQSQSYDVNWAYTFSELRRTPLVSFGNDSGFLLCPSVTYLIRHITDGVYYSLVGRDGFANAFGDAFQRYVGDVLKSGFGNNYEVLEEDTYGPRSRRNRSVDWIVQGDDGVLFIECKTRRPHIDTRTKLQSLDTIENDLESMSDSIVQIYKTLRDAVNGSYPHWQNRDKPIYPILVTLEEWYGFGYIQDKLLERVREKLNRAQLLQLLEDCPYTLCSVEELEFASQVMNTHGISNIMAEKLNGEHRLWLLSAYINHFYNEDLANLEALFPDAWAKIEHHIAAL